MLCFQGEDVLPVLLHWVGSGRHERLLWLPLALILHSEGRLGEISRDCDLRKVLQEVVDRHAKDSVIRMPHVHVSGVAAIGLRVTVGSVELVPDRIRPEILSFVAAVPVPFLGV